MAEFLSDEWIGELATAAASADVPVGGDDLVIEQVVTGAPRGDARYRLRMSAQGTTITKPNATTHDRAADLVLVTDYETARKLHQGVVRAQDALAAGALKVRGRPGCLTRVNNALTALDRAFGPVRARTTYPGDDPSDDRGGDGGPPLTER